MYFDCISPPVIAPRSSPPPHPFNFMFFLSKNKNPQNLRMNKQKTNKTKHNKTKPNKVHGKKPWSCFVAQPLLGMGPDLDMVDRPTDTPLEKTDLFSLAS